MGNQIPAPLFGNFKQNNQALFHFRGQNSGLVVKKYAASVADPGVDPRGINTDPDPSMAKDYISSEI